MGDEMYNDGTSFQMKSLLTMHLPGHILSSSQECIKHCKDCKYHKLSIGNKFSLSYTPDVIEHRTRR